MNGVAGEVAVGDESEAVDLIGRHEKTPRRRASSLRFASQQVARSVCRQGRHNGRLFAEPAAALQFPGPPIMCGISL